MAEANPDLAGFLPPLGRKFSVYEAASGRYKEFPLKRLPATAGCVVSVHLVRPILRDFQSKDLPSLPEFGVSFSNVSGGWGVEGGLGKWECP